MKEKSLGVKSNWQTFSTNNNSDGAKTVPPQKEIGIFFHCHLTTKYCKQIGQISEISVQLILFFRSIKNYDLYVFHKFAWFLF